LVVLKGRRRIGKSRLAEEFGKTMKTFSFLGLAPQKGVTAQSQREHFAVKLKEQQGVGGLKADDWDDLFFHLAKAVASGPVLVIFDEINWMGSKDVTFLPKLKSAWDTYFCKNPELILLLSGSMSGWIEKNILSSTGFFGRISLDITLEELPLRECKRFWGKNHHCQVSPFEFFKVLSVTGGVPRYLEMIQPELSAEKNLQRLMFRREGMLYNEFDRIFSDLFQRKSHTYKQIVMQLVHSACDMGAILKGIDHTFSGTLSGYLDDLVETGYLARDFTWDLKTAKRSKLSRYRLRDNFLRFYLRYVEPKKELIERLGEITIPQWSSIMGLQFENLILNHRKELYIALDIDERELIYDNPFFQRATKEREGCQIDWLIQTKFNILYLCEVKFSKEVIAQEVITEVQKKIKRLSLPKGFSIKPVLIHVNGVSDAVIESEFFAYIIDFGQLVFTR
jgi:uncharacterized protein